jgi:hypothetical protein
MKLVKLLISKWIIWKLKYFKYWLPVMINPLPLLKYSEDKSVTGIEFFSEEVQLFSHLYCNF